MFALDTNTLIYYFKGVGEVARHLLETPPQKIGIPTIVLYELESGIAKSTRPEKRRHALETLLSVVHILPFDAASATAAAEIRAELEKAGTPIGALDLLIAGTAVAHAKILVTHNTNEFSRIPTLRLVDWF